MPLNPDFYRRAHSALLSEIKNVIANETAETGVLNDSGKLNLELLSAPIKGAIAHPSVLYPNTQ